MRLLKSRNRAERSIIQYHPDNGNIFLECSCKESRILSETAVAHEGDDDAVGRGDLRADCRRRAEAHSRVAARSEDRTWRIDRELLPNAILVPANISRDNRIAREHRARISQDSFWSHRKLIAPFSFGIAGSEFRTIMLNCLTKFLALPPPRIELSRSPVERLERSVEIRDCANLNR